MTLGGRRRGLTGGQSINLVVHYDISHIQISTHGMKKVSYSDAVSIAITASNYDFQVGIGEMSAGSHRNGTSVQAMNSICMNEARKVGGAADAADHHEILWFDANIGGGFLNRFQVRRSHHNQGTSQGRPVP